MFRFVIIACTFLLSVLLYIDRVCISVAGSSIRQELVLTETQMGWVLAAFALGYALLQTPAGRWVDRLGPRRMLTGIVLLWSTLTALTGACWNYLSLLVIRFVFGAGEAGAFPGIARVTYNWIPMQERGIVTGLNFSGSRFGAAFALPGTAWLIHTYGWRTAFLIFGLLGIGWALVWWLLFRDKPGEHEWVSVPEKDYIVRFRQQTTASDKAESTSFPSRLSGPNRQAIGFAMAQYFCSNFTFFFALTWLYPHIQAKYGLASSDAGWLGAIPLLAGAVGSWTGGWLMDYLYGRQFGLRSRTIPAVIGFTLSAMGLLLSITPDSAEGSVVWLSVALLGADMTLPPSWAYCLDIGGERAGEVSGTMNMAGNLGALLTSLAFPYLKSWTGSVTPFFFIGALFNLIAAGLWFLQAAKKKSSPFPSATSTI